MDILGRRDYWARHEVPVMIVRGEGDDYLEVRGEWVDPSMFPDFDGLWHDAEL